MAGILGDGQLVDPTRERRQRLQRAIVIGWSIALGVMAVGVVGAAFVIWMKPILARAKDTTERDRSANESRVRKPSEFESPTMEAAVAIVTRALAVRDPADVERLIRPGSLTPREVVDHLAAMAAEDGPIEDYSWQSNVDRNGLLLDGVLVIFKQPKKAKSRLALLTPDKQGVWKMDFAAFARSVEPSWEKLLEQTSGEGVVRVYAGRDRYYNGPFADDSVWVAYGLGSDDLDISLYGYCKRGSPQHKAMELMAEAADGSLIRATLEVRKIEGSGSRQFEIIRVLAEDWVMGEKAFDTTVE